MCPLCLSTLVVIVTATTGIGAATVAAATRIAKSTATPKAANPSTDQNPGAGGAP